MNDAQYPFQNKTVRTSDHIAVRIWGKLASPSKQILLSLKVVQQKCRGLHRNPRGIDNVHSNRPVETKMQVRPD
jgi:hypothetical protein